MRHVLALIHRIFQKKLTRKSKKYAKKPSFRFASVRDVHHLFPVSQPATVKKRETLDKILDKFFTSPGHGVIYVVNKNNKLLGMITIHDFLKLGMYKAGKGSELSDTEENETVILEALFSRTAEDIMRHPITVTLNESGLSALKKMEDYHLTSIPIVNKKTILVGELNSLELLRSIRDLYQSK